MRIDPRNTNIICSHLLGFTPTPTQTEIINHITFNKHKRIIINCMTRYGKTKAVSIAILYYALTHPNKKILIISPIIEQSNILRNYLATTISTCPIFDSFIEKNEGREAINKEFNKKRYVFTNNTSIQLLSAEGTGERLMGHGGDLIILDESCLIPKQVWQNRISRMLLDNPNAILVEIGNPWNKDNHFFEHWNDPSFHKIHIDYIKAISEGRITQEQIDEQIKECGGVETLSFTVLYKSQFPDQSVDGLFSYDKIRKAINKKIENNISTYEVISCDVADKGIDFTVIMRNNRSGSFHEIKSIYSEAISENTAVAGRILNMINHKTSQVNIDGTGIGVGVVSMLKERSPKNVTINGVMYGESARNNKIYANKKAELYFELKKLFDEEKISIPEHPKLINELLSIRWEYTSNGRIKIIDPDKSPDFASALTFAVYSNTQKYMIK